MLCPLLENAHFSAGRTVTWLVHPDHSGCSLRGHPSEAWPLITLSLSEYFSSAHFFAAYFSSLENKLHGLSCSLLDSVHALNNFFFNELTATNSLIFHFILYGSVVHTSASLLQISAYSMHSSPKTTFLPVFKKYKFEEAPSERIPERGEQAHVHFCHLGVEHKAARVCSGASGRVALSKGDCSGGIQRSLLAAQAHRSGHSGRHQGSARTHLSPPSPARRLTHRGLSQINRDKASSFPEPAKDTERRSPRVPSGSG